jgi:hypothetical protein
MGHGLLFGALFQVGRGGDLLVGDGLLRWFSNGFCRSAISFHFFFFFHFCLIFLVRGFVGLIAFRKMLSWWVCGFAVMVGLWVF